MAPMAKPPAAETPRPEHTLTYGKAPDPTNKGKKRTPPCEQSCWPQREARRPPAMSLCEKVPMASVVLLSDGDYDVLRRVTTPKWEPNGSATKKSFPCPHSASGSLRISWL